MRAPRGPTGILMLVLLLAAGCWAGQYRSVLSGVVVVGKMRITLGPGWQSPPGSETPETLGGTRVFSRSGLEHDRLLSVAGVADGEPIFRPESAGELPVFRVDMTPTEIARFVADSMAAALWGGTADVEASKPRAQGYTGVAGFKFDIDADIPSAPNQRGIGGGFVHDDRLYLNIYVAEIPRYHERYIRTAEKVIDSAIPTVKTIRMSALRQRLPPLP